MFDVNGFAAILKQATACRPARSWQKSARRHAVVAFLDDIHERGLSDKVLLIITGEFGRTPRINKRAGRDHWGNLCTLALAGGGLEMGQVIGRSDRKVSVPASNPVTVTDLMATVIHSLFDISQIRLLPDLPLELIQFVSQGMPIRGLAYRTGH